MNAGLVSSISLTLLTNRKNGQNRSGLAFSFGLLIFEIKVNKTGGGHPNFEGSLRSKSRWLRLQCVPKLGCYYLQKK